MSQKKFTNAKIVIFGSKGVGKTAFTVRFITKRYIGDYESSKEMTYTHKLTSSRDDVINLELLDTASDATKDEIDKNIKWGDGFVLLYSITDRKSYEEVNRYKDMLLQIKGPDKPLVLVANKIDLVSARDVSEEEGVSLAGQLDCPIFELSVAEGYQLVRETMEEVMVQLRREFIKNLSIASASNEKPRSKLYNMRKVLKKRIGRSHSDTF